MSILSSKNTRKLIAAKKKGRKWTMLTAYDAPSAEILEKGGVDFILVGDSLGMVLLGYPSTTWVTMDEMIHHAKAVRRGAPKSFVIGDLPLKGIEGGPRQALFSAKRFINEASCDAVKLEWNQNAIEIADLLIRHKIPVMGHLGLTPQTAEKTGGFRVRGQEAQAASEIYKNAKEFERRGAFSILLECVPSPLAKMITESLKVPTIGIGAGPHCDGQVLVFNDVVGLFTKFKPKFVKRYAETETEMSRAIQKYVKEVERGVFPSQEHSYAMNPNELSQLKKLLGKEKEPHGN